MNKRKIALGPGAASLILIVVLLSLSMLAMLMQIGARNDYNLTTRSAQMISRIYDLSADSERRLAELDAVLAECQKETQDMDAYLALVAEKLPEGFEIEEDIVSWKHPLDIRTMTCSVRLLPPGTTPLIRANELSANSEPRLSELEAILAECQKETQDQDAYMALMAEKLPGDYEIHGDTVIWQDPVDNRNLNCSVRLLPPGETPRAEWTSHMIKTDEPEDDWEW